MSYQGYIATIFRRNKINLPAESVKTIVQRNGAHPWFIWAFNSRNEFRNLCESSLFLARDLPLSAKILETGCGCALNLIWFGQQGFQCLYGIDIDTKSLEAGREIAELAKIPIHLWVDNGLNPANIAPGPFDAIIALNWTHLLDEFDLKGFLEHYSKLLNPKGYILIDIIDSSYNQVPKNQFLTSDWEKPEDQRRPSEYKKRYSRREISEICEEIDLHIVKIFSHKQIIPKYVYIITK